MFVPGLALLNLVCQRRISLSDALGASFHLSLLIHCVCGLLAIALGLSSWRALCLVGLVTLCLNTAGALHLLRHPMMPAHHQREENVVWKTAAIVLSIIVAALMYRMGTKLSHCDVGLQTALVYQYATAGFLEPKSMSLVKGVVSPNIFAPWEFTASMASLAASVWPGDLFMRVRFFFPLLAVWGYVVLLRQCIPSVHKTAFLTVVAVAVALGGILARDVGAWKGAFFSGSERFFPLTIHQDVAMDLVLPVVMALMIRFLRSPTTSRGLLVGAAIYGFFFLHVREFFQTYF